MEKEAKALDKMAEWLACDCLEDICKLCVHEEESNLEWTLSHKDIPEGVEGCKFKRAGGIAACKKGIIKFFAQKE